MAEEALAKLTLVSALAPLLHCLRSRLTPRQAEWPADRVRETFLEYFRSKARPAAAARSCGGRRGGQTLPISV